MDKTTSEAHLPLDTDNCIRRECPYCKKEFKIRKSDFESLKHENEYFCPYCGQSADVNKWFTTAQKDYSMNIAANVGIDLINKELIKSLKKMNSRSFRMETRDVPRRNELINPEIDDMVFFALPCCNKQIKISEDWDGATFVISADFHMTERRGKMTEYLPQGVFP